MPGVQLSAEQGGLKIVESMRFDNANALLAAVARQLAALLSGEQPAMVKECAGEDCTLWFVDRSKAHRRLFCSPTACGKRA